MKVAVVYNRDSKSDAVARALEAWAEVITKS